MLYMGGKARLAKYLLPIILKGRKPLQWYVEPFVGGANMIDKVSGLRIGKDINRYSIALLREMQKDTFNPPYISETEYKNIRNNKDNYPEWLVGYAGFCLSFGSKFFGGYKRDKAGKRDFEDEAQRHLRAQAPKIKGVIFSCGHYLDMVIPPNSIIYCDPPYEGATEYSIKFNHVVFWEWCRKKSKEGHSVFISEFNAPPDFKCLFEIPVKDSINKTRKNIEKLFTYKEVTK